MNNNYTVNSQFQYNTNYRFGDGNVYSPKLQRTAIISGWPWITWDSAELQDNKYPIYLAGLSVLQPIHGTALANKIALMQGDALYADTTDEYKRVIVESLIQKFNLKELWDRIVTDFETFNGFSFTVRYNKKGYICGLDHIDFGDVRLAREGWDDKYNRCFYISADWANIYYPATTQNDEQIKKPEGTNFPRKWHGYNPDKFDVNVAENDQYNTSYAQIYWYSNYTPQNKFYPIAPYAPAIQYIQLEWELSQFHRASVQNGFSPSAIVQMVDDSLAQVQEPYTDRRILDINGNVIENPEWIAYDRKRYVLDGIRNSFTGANNANKIITQIVSNKDQFANITTFNNSLDNNIMSNLTELTTQKVISAHQLTSPVIAGQSGGQQLGGNQNEIIAAIAMFEDLYVLPRRQRLLKALNDMLNRVLPGLNLGCINVKDTHQVALMLTDAAQREVLTTNERRKAVGYKPVDGGDTIVGLDQMPIDNKPEDLFTESTNTDVRTGFNKLAQKIAEDPVFGAQLHSFLGNTSIIKNKK